MKKSLLFLPALCILACTNAKYDGYTIKATFTGIDSALVIVKTQAKSDIPADTIQMVKGKFTLQNKLVTPEAYIVTIQGNTPVRFPLYLENCVFTVTGNIDDIKNIIVSGGPYHAVMDSIAKAKEAITANYPSMEELSKEYSDPATTAARKEELQTIAQELSGKVNEVETNYIAQHPTSRIALNRFVSSTLNGLGNDATMEELKEQLAAFTAALPEGSENRLIQKAEKTIATLESIQIGMPAPDFTMKDPKGNSISLSDIYPKNKITMIDFWAGWCGPCRQFNPTLVTIYNKHRKNGFGILGVSFDHTESQWTKAIADDKLTWPQISELTYWENTARYLYNINYIPQNVFVDQNGIIVAKRVEGDKMDTFLTDFLKKK